MKKIIRLISLLLALVTLTALVAACAETTGEETTEGPAATEAPAIDVTEAPITEEITLFTPDDLDEKYNFDTTITILMWDDYRMTEFYAEETGDIIDDSIYHRNVKVS